MALNADDFNFENNLNNRIATINNDILNNRIPCVGIGNRIYANENGNPFSVQLILPDNWVNFYENDRNNNFNTIRICYVYSLLHYYRDLNRIYAYRDILDNIDANNIDEFANEMNNVYNTIDMITDSITHIGNIYLGIILQEE